MCWPFVQYGGGLAVSGLAVSGTATLTNSAIYQNEATVGARLLNLPRPLLHRPAELTVFLACVQGVAACILNPVDPFPTIDNTSAMTSW